MWFTLLIVAGLLLFASRMYVSEVTIPGIRAEFMERFSTTPTFWQDLTTRLPSTAASEDYAFLGSVPMMREWIGGRLAHGLRSESYSIKSQEYEATIYVAQKEVEDDQTGQIRIRIGELAANAATHKDYLLELLLINGESVGYNAYDGKPFFSETHESGSSGAQSNLLTHEAVDGDNPTQAEFRAALTKAIAAMIAYKDDAGQAKRITPTGLVVVVPPTMLFTALESLNLQLVSVGTTPLQANVIQNAARVIALPGLTDASKFYLAKTDVPVRPFIFQDRLPIEFKGLDFGSERAFTTGELLFGVRARYAITYGYWQYAVSIDFT